MRVLTVVLALVAIPFVAGVSQRPFQDPKNCGAHLDEANPGVVLVHGGRHGVMDRPCASTETPPPPPAPEPAPACTVSAPAATGTQTIDGKVSLGEDPWSPLPGWCIQLTGTVTATAMTQADGTYRFSGLPDGTYTVCEVLESGWVQTFPTALNASAVCPGNVYGWTFTLSGFSGSFVNFRNIVAP